MSDRKDGAPSSARTGLTRPNKNGGRSSDKRVDKHAVNHDQAELLDSAAIPIHFVGRDGYIVWANQAELAMLGYKPEEYIGRHIAEFHVDRAVIEEILERLTRGESIHQCPARLRARDGSILDVLISSNAVWENGEFLHTRCFTQDMTEQRRTEDALRESEERYRSLVEMAPDVIFSVSADGGVFTGLSAGFEWVTGWPPEEWIGRPFPEILHPDDIPFALQKFEELLAGETPLPFELRVRSRSGEYVIAEIRVRPKKQAGKVVEGFGIALDVTERKRTENALRESERQYRELVEALGVAVYTTDADGHIVLYNETAAALWGRRPEPGKDRWCGSWRLYWPDGRPMAHEECPMALSLKEKRPVRGAEVMVEQPDGSRFYVTPYPTPLLDASGNLVGGVNVLIDITKRRRMEDVLRTRERQQEAVATLGQRALTEDDLSTLMDEAAALTAGTLDVEYCKVLELLPDGETLFLRAGVGWKEGLIGKATVSAGAESQAGYTLLSDAPVIVEDLQTETRFLGPPLLLEHGVVSGLSVIIQGRERPFGVLGAHSRRRRAFTQDDINFLQSMANVLAAAIERRRTEDALREAERRSRMAMEAGRMGAWEWDIASGAVKWSETLERIHGLEPGAFEGTFEAYEKDIFPDDRQRVLASVQQALQTGRHDILYRIICPDGQVRWLEAHGQVIRDRTGKPVRMLGVCTDVTERQQAEEALAEAEEKYRSIFESATFGIFQTTQDGRFLSANPALARMLGYDSPEDLLEQVRDIGRQIHVDPERRAEFVRLLSQQREVRGFESQAQRKDGGIIWIALTARTVNDESGGVTFEGIVEDITERKRAEEAVELLAEAGAQLGASLDYRTTLSYLARLIVPQLADWCGIYVTERDGHLTRVALAHPDPSRVELAKKMEERYPINLDAPLGVAKVLKTGEPEFYPIVPESLFREAAQSEGHLRMMLGAGLKSGMIVPLKARGRTLGAIALASAESGRLYEAADLVLAEEIGRRAGLALDNSMLYRDLQAALEAKDEFLGLISHELRTPITAVYGGARMLRSRADRLDQESKNRILGDIEQESDRLYRMVENLLALSRIELGQKVETEPVLIERVLHKLVSAFQQRRPGRRVEVEEVEGSGQPVAAQPTYLEQVIRNLLSNAAKYSSPDAPIDIRLENDGDHVSVCVMDRGPGIEEEEADLIFDRFYRSERTSQSATGAGIGLTVCKRLIEAQSGRIWARPREGGGLELSFALPVYKEEDIE